VLITVAAFAAVGAAWGSSLLTRRDAAAPPPEPRLILTGKLDLLQAKSLEWTNYVLTDGGTACTGHGGYAYVRAEMPITVEDEGGTLIGQGWLQSGELSMSLEMAKPACTFPFLVLNLPRADRYLVTWDRRGGTAFTRAELDDLGWAVTLTLGP
jgi:hypothetical protein